MLYACFTTGFIAWYVWYERRISAQSLDHPTFDQTLALKPIRAMRALSFAVFLVAVFTAVRTMPKGRELWATTILIYFMFATESLFAFKVQKRIRHLDANIFESLKLVTRQLLAFGFLYVTYLSVMGAVSALFLAAAKYLIHDPAALKWASYAGLPLGVFTGLLVTFLLSPIFVRILFPSSLVDPEKQYGNLSGREFTSLVNGAFEKAGFSEPKLRVLELDRFKIHNALISGFRFKKFGMGGPSVFFTSSLLRELNMFELEAVIKHEVSHLSLNHLRKRMFFGFAMVFASYFPVYGTLSLLEWVIPNLSRGLLSMVGVIVALGFQIFMLRKQVRGQEFEADAYAVAGLGARPEALVSALEKLDRLNHQNSKRKSLASYLNPASAHPTTVQRGEALAGIVLRDIRRSSDEDAA